VFVGESVHSLDSKNRVVVPRRLQDGIERNAEGHLQTILTRGFEGCLFLFSERRFLELVQRLRTEAFEGSEARRMQRLFFATAHRAPIDGSGRILLPDKLRQMVGIQRDVVMVGLIDRIEIWPAESWHRFEADNSDSFDALDSVLCIGSRPPQEAS
jgi:MraZ protein